MPTHPHPNQAQVEAFVSAWRDAVDAGSAEWTHDSERTAEVTRRMWTAMSRWPAAQLSAYRDGALAVHTAPALARPGAAPAAIGLAAQASLLIFCRPWLSERSFWTTYRRLQVPFEVPELAAAPDKGSLKRVRRLAQQPVHVALSTSVEVARR